jgi:ABC-type antimicrobial peptide transport system permease subunit
LFGVSPYDPVLLAAAVSVMLIVTASGAYLPARRALRIDPVRELNAE